jgi:hypothetical protein
MPNFFLSKLMCSVEIKRLVCTCQVARLDGQQFANEMNLQVKSKRLVVALEELAEKSEQLAELRNKH